jgi:predicted nucleotidyltransferase
MFEKLIENNNELISIFQKHKVIRAYVFGSALTNCFNEKSDVDFLVSFNNNLDPLEKGELWWDLHDTLRDFLQREIDLVTENSLKNPYFIKELENTKKLIYEQ